MTEGRAARARKQSSARRARPRARPPRPLQDYAGEYEHPGYGRLSVFQERGRLKVRYNAIVFRVEHDRDDVFRMFGRHEDPLELKASFNVDESGRIDSVAIPFESTVPDIVFRKEIA